MIISRTPLRVSIAGGGTDMEYFYSRYSGKVISFSINKYIYIIVKSRIDEKIVLNYKEREIVDSVEEIKHGLIRESLKKVGIDNGVEITSIADIPSSGSGLGSSSAFTVGLLNALYAYTGIQKNQEQLASEACEIEIDILNAPIGKQDQYATSIGGLKTITFKKDNTVLIKPINDNNNLYNNLLNNAILVNSNIYRDASKILKIQKNNFSKNINTLVGINDSVDRVLNMIIDQDFDSFYNHLNDYFQEKNKLTDSNKDIQLIYNSYVPSICHAGKICGAGGGGYFLFFTKEGFKNNLNKHLKIKIDNFGTTIIYNNY
tara:strand:- start:679 stop:1629 length:951 start_codon:yes stop_codon:yes gene_type:complete